MSKLLLAAGMALICGTAAWGKNNVPDFRYPETVINDATKQIEKADKKGNHKALVTCNVDNEASRRIILSNGGVYENTIEGMERYWIEL